MSLRTERTFLLARAICSAWLFSAVLLAKPESCTIPFRVSTLMEPAETILSSMNLALMAVVMAASST